MSKPTKEQTRVFNAKRRFTQYGIDKEHYEEMLVEQDGKCAICHMAAKLVIGHCHLTKRVRGLLCAFCNRGIGQLRDDTARMASAISYLQREPRAFVRKPKPFSRRVVENRHRTCVVVPQEIWEQFESLRNNRSYAATLRAIIIEAAKRRGLC